MSNDIFLCIALALSMSMLSACGGGSTRAASPGVLPQTQSLSVTSSPQLANPTVLSTPDPSSEASCQAFVLANPGLGYHCGLDPDQNPPYQGAICVFDAKGDFFDCVAATGCSPIAVNSTLRDVFSEQRKIQAASTATNQTQATNCSTPLPVQTPSPKGAAIAAKAAKEIGHYDGGYGAPCGNACLATVEHIVKVATGEYIGGTTKPILNTDPLRSAGGITQISQSSSLPEDLLIVDSPDGRDGHIGICLNVGCTDVISNSSSHCTFTFRSRNDARFSYPGSPYTNGSSGFWRVK